MNNRITEKIHENSSENGMYYKKLADKYRIAKFLILILLAFFIVFAVLFGNGSMRGVHFRYLVKYMNVNPATLDKRYEDIAYAVGGGSSFALYHDDLAVLGEGKMTLYDLAGDLQYRADLEKGNPAVHSDGKYLAAYVPGGETLTLFHSFGKAETLSFSGSIAKACVSKTGSLAVCLKSQKGTEICFLDSDFKTQQILESSGGIVIDMAISDDGRTLSVLSLVGSDGAYYTRYDFWNLKKGELLQNDAFHGRKPLATGFFENGRSFILLDRAICFCSQNGEISETIALAAEPLTYYVDQNSLLLLTSQGDVLLYQSNGKQRLSLSAGESILDAKVHEDAIYLLSESQVSIYDFDGEPIAAKPISSGALAFYILDDKSILLCYASETKRVCPTE